LRERKVSASFDFRGDFTDRNSDLRRRRKGVGTNARGSKRGEGKDVQYEKCEREVYVRLKRLPTASGGGKESRSGKQIFLARKRKSMSRKKNSIGHWQRKAEKKEKSETGPVSGRESI